MAIQGDIYCPNCRARNYERTTSSHIVHAGKAVFALGAGLATGFLVGGIKSALHIPGPSGAGKVANAIMNDGSYDYVCKRCGCEFEVSYKDNKVTGIKKM